MAKIIKITEDQVKKIIETQIDEQHGTGPWYNDGPGPGRLKTVSKPTVMNGSLFANGVDTINTNSPEFKKSIDEINRALRLAGQHLTVTVQGGASAVGQNRGYDNKSLAQRRATNYINAIKPYFKDKVTFVMGNSVLGKATVKNSPEANAEQFVKLNYTETQTTQNPAIDNTAARLQNLQGKQGVGNDNLVNVNFRIDKNKLMAITDLIKKNGGQF